MIEITELNQVGPVEIVQITALMRELHDDDRTPTLEEAQKILKNENVVVMVAREDERIVGVATLYILQKFGKLSAHLEDVIVDEKNRGQGLGKKLVQAVIDVAKKRGLHSIALTSQPKRIAANRLYVSLGFIKRETNAYKLTL